MTNSGPRPSLQSGLYAIIDDASPQAPLALVRAALLGGARVVQLRFKRSGARALLEAAREALPLCHSAGALLFLNDRPDLAVLAGADGVHLGQDDLPLPEARRLVGPRMLIGLSTHSEAEIASALEQGADCIGFGPVFATATKAATAPGSSPLPSPHGLAGLAKAVARAGGTPVIAIGGITSDTAAAIGSAGAWCLAAISALCAAPDPALAARALVLEFARGQSQAGDPHVV